MVSRKPVKFLPERMAYLMEEGKYEFSEDEDSYDQPEAKNWNPKIHKYDFSAKLAARYHSLGRGSTLTLDGIK